MLFKKGQKLCINKIDLDKIDEPLVYSFVNENLIKSTNLHDTRITGKEKENISFREFAD